jgi:hypothetical protein
MGAEIKGGGDFPDPLYPIHANTPSPREAIMETRMKTAEARTLMIQKQSNPSQVNEISTAGGS